MYSVPTVYRSYQWSSIKRNRLKSTQITLAELLLSLMPSLLVPGAVAVPDLFRSVIKSPETGLWDVMITLHVKTLIHLSNSQKNVKSSNHKSKK